MLQEIKVNTDEMNRGLSTVMHAISAKPLKPIYGGILMNALHDQVVLTATDGAISVRTAVNAEVKTSGKAVVPAKLFFEMIRRQPGKEASVAVDDKGTAKITGMGSKASMVCMAAEDYPSIQDVEQGCVIGIPAGKLKNAIQRVMFAVSTDESRKVLTGILVEVDHNEIRLVGIDGFKLAVMRIPQSNDVPNNDRLIVPGATMSELAKILPDDDSEVTVTYNQSHAVFRTGDVRVGTTLLVGEFIDYKKLMSAGNAKTSMTVDKAALYEAMERCSLMAREGKNNLITLEVGESGVKMSARAERGDVHEDVPAQVDGEPVKIAFNAQYLMDAVKNAEPDEIAMHMSGPAAPCFIRPVDGDVFEYLVLPVRTM